MRKRIPILLLGAVLAAPLLISAEEPQASGPPKLIQIWREEVKIGKGQMHDKSEAALAASMQRAKFPYYSVGLNSLSGAGEAWFVAPLNSFADWQKADESFRKDAALKADLDRLVSSEGEVVNKLNTMFASYNKDLSYRPDFKLGETRFFSVTMLRLKPGYYEELKQLRANVNAAHEKHNLNEHMLVYDVEMGAPAGTLLVFQPYKTMEEMDALDARHDDAYRNLLGADWSKRLSEFSRNGILSQETNLFAVNPKTSYVSEQTVAVAPDFWHPKPEVAVAPGKKSKGGMKEVAKE